MFRHCISYTTYCRNGMVYAYPFSFFTSLDFDNLNLAVQTPVHLIHECIVEREMTSQLVYIGFTLWPLKRLSESFGLLIIKHANVGFCQQKKKNLLYLEQIVCILSSCTTRNKTSFIKDCAKFGSY